MVLCQDIVQGHSFQLREDTMQSVNETLGGICLNLQERELFFWGLWKEDPSISLDGSVQEYEV